MCAFKHHKYMAANHTCSSWSATCFLVFIHKHIVQQKTWETTSPSLPPRENNNQASTVQFQHRTKKGEKTSKRVSLVLFCHKVSKESMFLVFYLTQSCGRRCQAMMMSPFSTHLMVLSVPTYLTLHFFLRRVTAQLMFKLPTLIRDK